MINLDKIDTLANECISNKPKNPDSFGYQFRLFTTYFHLSDEFFAEFFNTNEESVNTILKNIYATPDANDIAKEELVVLNRIVTSYREADFGNFENYIADNLINRIRTALKNKNTLKLKKG